MITVYVDVLFLINFSVDYIVLVLTGAVFHFRVKRWRELLAAFFLSVYAMWALLLCGSYVLLILTACAVIAGVCRFVYPTRSIGGYIKCILVFTALTFIFGGLVELLFRIMGYLTGGFVGEKDGRQVLVFAGLALLSGGMIYIGNRLLDRSRGVRYVQVAFELVNRTFRAQLMVDSGNLVCEPISGRRVLFLTEAYAKKCGLVKYINNNEDIIKIKRYVCIETANGKRAVEAYLCDKIQVVDREVCGAVSIMQGGKGECCDGIFPSALL